MMLPPWVTSWKLNRWYGVLRGQCLGKFGFGIGFLQHSIQSKFERPLVYVILSHCSIYFSCQDLLFFRAFG